jgi:tetratricopeptide (TPR) repeat protein
MDKKLKSYKYFFIFYEKALEIYKRTVSLNHLNLDSFYNNIGLVYENMDKYSKVRALYEYAVDTPQHSLPSNHPKLEIVRVYRDILFLLKIQMGCTHRSRTQTMFANIDCRKDLHNTFCISTNRVYLC